MLTRVKMISYFLTITSDAVRRNLQQSGLHEASHVEPVVVEFGMQVLVDGLLKRGSGRLKCHEGLADEYIRMFTRGKSLEVFGSGYQFSGFYSGYVVEIERVLDWEFDMKNHLDAIGERKVVNINAKTSHGGNKDPSGPDL